MKANNLKMIKESASCLRQVADEFRFIGQQEKVYDLLYYANRIDELLNGDGESGLNHLISILDERG